MRFLGLDVGTRNIGVAFYDSNVGIIFPRDVVLVKTEEYAVGELKKIIERDKIDKIVVGLPVNFNSTRSKIQEYVEKFCNKLKNAVNVEIEFFDERFTTIIAQTVTSKNVDSISASLILEGYLKSKGYFK